MKLQFLVELLLPICRPKGINQTPVSHFRCAAASHRAAGAAVTAAA